MGKKIEKKGFIEGYCSFCKSMDLEYGVLEIEDGVLYYPVSCKCGAVGREYYNIEFTDIVMNRKVKK